MNQTLIRWRNPETMGVTVVALDEMDEPVVVIGEAVPEGSIILTDDEYLSILVSQFTAQKRSFLEAQGEVEGMAEEAKKKVEKARADMKKTGLSQATIDLLTPPAPALKPREYQVPEGTLESLVAAHLISVDQAEWLIEQVMAD